uniref:Uncharacterized protein n=1 Tax=Rhizophora mucronata TaxID=61149 RepID=A0A2P2PTX5_RHIMU
MYNYKIKNLKERARTRKYPENIMRKREERRSHNQKTKNRTN